MPSLDQTDYDLRFDVGPLAAARLAPFSDALVVVDVLSFSTAVAVAVARGAVVYPYPFKRRRNARGLPLAGRLATTYTGDGAPETYANSLGALCAGRRGTSRYSLSPPTLRALSPGDRIVLPSPNGATVSLAAPATPSFAGCLRNAKPVAAAAQALGPRVAVIACGERWEADDSLRYAFEDQLGAGAILSFLSGSLSPEAAAALAVYRSTETKLAELLGGCASGKELVARGYGADVVCAAELNSDGVAARLQPDADGCFAYRRARA